MSRHAKNRPPEPSQRWLRAGMVVLLAVGAGSWFLSTRSISEKVGKKTVATSFADYAGPESCRACHAKEYELYQNSHHALAERGIDSALDKTFFKDQVVHHGTQTTQVRFAEFQTQDKKIFPLQRVIGVAPLRQFLTPTTQGRLQVTELAVDPVRGDWFDIFGSEDRQFGEWGHWTGRGMNWNSMCAACHNTALRKNYDPVKDSYTTAMAAPAVTCEACHGPMATHAQWQKKNPRTTAIDPTLKSFNRDQVLDTCGSCHARRAELTGEFQPGGRFLDHYVLTIPDDTDVYYPDGQIHDEDYEYASFLGSKMYAAGVRCSDCHEPHSGKTRAVGNELCMKCHGLPIAPAPKIDPAAHSHHGVNSTGALCVSCHMPQTTYMQRHARRDHGFTIPDPELTKRLNIPNACNRCHKEKSTDWAIQNVEKWYGPKMNRSTRDRAEVIAGARADQNEAWEKILGMVSKEKIPLWRAVEIGLLRNHVSDPKARQAMLQGAIDASALVRATAARSLETQILQGDTAAEEQVQKLLQDPVRSVRVEAAWTLRAKIETNSTAGQDLMLYLAQNADQPAGLLQIGTFHSDRGENNEALGEFQRAVNWDPNSAVLHHALAVGLSLNNQTDKAVTELQTACRLAPNEPEYHFKLALALNETGKLPDVVAELERAVKLSPHFGQAWYNLGLAHASLNELDTAIKDLEQAESADPNSPRFPYARATILLRLHRNTEARQAAERALQIDPSNTEATALLESLTK